MIAKPHILFPLLAVLTVLNYVLWARFIYPRIALRKEYKRQLKLDAERLVEVHKIQRY